MTLIEGSGKDHFLSLNSGLEHLFKILLTYKVTIIVTTTVYTTQCDVLIKSSRQNLIYITQAGGVSVVLEALTAT